MDGNVLKTRILQLEPVLADLARKLGVSAQSLNQTLGASDIKTGFVEQLASVYSKPIGYFFGENISVNDHSRHDSHSTCIGDSIHVESGEHLVSGAPVEYYKFEAERLIEENDTLQKDLATMRDEYNKLKGAYMEQSKTVDLLKSLIANNTK